MIELAILLAGFAALAWNIPVNGQAVDRYAGKPYGRFDANREGYEQPTRDMQKRRNPVVPRAAGNAYNDSVLSSVNRSSANVVFSEAFRQNYTDMLNKNRVRPSKLLDKFWKSTSSHMQGTYSSGFVGKATAQSTLDTSLPYEFTSDYVPGIYAGVYTPYNRRL